MNEMLRNVVAQVLQRPPDEITPNLAQKDVVAWDSQGHLELIMAIEDEFGVEFELEEATRLRTVGDIEAALRRHEVPV